MLYAKRSSVIGFHARTHARTHIPSHSSSGLLVIGDLLAEDVFEPMPRRESAEERVLTVRDIYERRIDDSLDVLPTSELQ